MNSQLGYKNDSETLALVKASHYKVATNRILPKLKKKKSSKNILLQSKEKTDRVRPFSVNSAKYLECIKHRKKKLGLLQKDPIANGQLK